MTQNREWFPSLGSTSVTRVSICERNTRKTLKPTIQNPIHESFVYVCTYFLHVYFLFHPFHYLPVFLFQCKNTIVEVCERLHAITTLLLCVSPREKKHTRKTSALLQCTSVTENGDELAELFVINSLHFERCVMPPSRITFHTVLTKKWIGIDVLTYSRMTI